MAGDINGGSHWYSVVTSVAVMSVSLGVAFFIANQSWGLISRGKKVTATCTQIEYTKSGTDNLAMRDASLAALTLEQEIYGAAFRGDEVTRAALTLAYLQTGEMKALITMLPDDDSTGRKEFLSLLIDGDHPREKTLEFFSLSVDIGNWVRSERSEASMEKTLERLNALAIDLNVLHRMPVISWSLAGQYDAKNDRAMALVHARLAYRNTKDE